MAHVILPRLETKQSRVFGKIPDPDRDHWVWSGPDQVPIGLGLNFPNTSNYAIYDKELLSVIHGLEEWRHILEGTKHTIEILNNH